MNPLIIIITGSTDGIGKATARQLASDGNEVIIHGRNKQKGNEILETCRICPLISKI